MKMKKIKLQFDFTKESLKRIDALKERIDAVSRAEVIRKALRLYDYITSKLNEGYTLHLEKDGKKIEIVLS